MAIFNKVVVVMTLLAILAAATEAQQCSSQLGGLNVCAPFVIPGTANQPSTDCCSALSGVSHQCICNTLQIASRLPALCNLPALNCNT